jgi:3-dehydroquinate synthase
MKETTKLFSASESSSYQKLNDFLKTASTWILVTDENTERHCREIFLKKLGIQPHHSFVLIPGEKDKNMAQVEKLTHSMLHSGMDRHSVLVNLGGGVVSDIGGFAAAIFKRGISFVNIPTTLMAMVDAGLGGKTGVNLDGVKNQLGSFHHPVAVLNDSAYLSTLPKKEMNSGYAEIIKHALIADDDQWEVMQAINSLDEIKSWDDFIARSAEIKLNIVQKDPTELGHRKLLNFGHSVGHAFEAYCHSNHVDVSHGHAVAAGMLVEAKISMDVGLMEEETFNDILEYLGRFYSVLHLNPADLDEMVRLVSYDKKNSGGKLVFTLLEKVGQAHVHQEVSVDQLKSALSYYIHRK